MRVQKVLDKFGFMSGEGISNDMNLPPPRLTGHDVVEKGDELLTGMARSRAPNDFSCFAVQRRVQSEAARTGGLTSSSPSSTHPPPQSPTPPSHPLTTL